MAIPESWNARAHNTAPDSENRIHSNDVARDYGFDGGLVPGVTVTAYLVHPAVCTWGEAWLERGRAQVRVQRPVYDGDDFQVRVSEPAPTRYKAELTTRGDVRAEAVVELCENLPEPPLCRGDPILARDHERPPATPEIMQKLRTQGLGAMRARWVIPGAMSSYLCDAEQMPELLKSYANSAFVLGLSNWILAANVQLGPWLHLQTDAQHFAAIAAGDELLIEAAIEDLFEKKGHHFVDLDVAVFDATSRQATARIRLRAIYQLRPHATG
jgi:hypothetical protein